MAKRVRGPKREVCWDDRFYKVKSDSIEIPDLSQMERFAALSWLCRNTYPRGYSRPNALAGIGDAIAFTPR